jgi:hypothetical protein
MTEEDKDAVPSPRQRKIIHVDYDARRQAARLPESRFSERYFDDLRST